MPRVPQTPTRLESPLSVPVPRTELILALAITLIGFVARFALLDELAIEHFDEGVYASDLWFPDDGFQYPDRFLYAPPLLPFLIEWPMMIFPQARWAPFLPSLLLGSLTVPLAWWSVRRWTTGAAGVAAASLIALSDFHITMSRSALTDAPLVFFLLLAVWLAVESLSRTSYGLAIAAGLATGLAWATKYNGWLALAIADSGAGAAWLLWPRPVKSEPAKSQDESEDCTSSSTRLVSVGVCVVVMIIVAVLVWFPVWWDLQPVGGYARVAENHSQYITGFKEWWPSAVRQEAVQRHYARWPTLLSGWLAVVAAACVLRVERSTWNSSDRHDDSSSEASNGASDPGVKRSTWNQSTLGQDRSDAASDDTAKQGVKRSTWNEPPHETNSAIQRDSDAESKGEERSTWNHEDAALSQVEPPRSTTSITSPSRSTWNESDFVLTVSITAALAGAVVLSPLVALSIWSLTELIATALSLRNNQKSRLSNPGHRKSVSRKPAGSKSVKQVRAKQKNSEAAKQTEAAPEDEHRSRQWFGTWLHLAWLCGLLLATPMYRPYPRLVLPLMCVGSLATGAAIVRLLKGRLIARLSAAQETDTATEAGRSWRRPQVKFIWLLPLIFLCCWRATAQPAGAWQNRSALADIADEVIAAATADCKDEPLVNANVRFVIYVYGEPGLFFHIPQDSEPGEPVIPVRPVMDLSFAKPEANHPRIPTYVLAGPHAWKTEQFGQQLRDVQDSMKLIDVFPYRVSDFVLLDDHSPEHLARHRKDDVRLFRVDFDPPIDP